MKKGDSMTYYKNGYGQPIYNPKAYYQAVREDRYGYSRNNKRYQKGAQNELYEKWIRRTYL